MQIGPYTVVEEVARGGMGVVYRARGPRGNGVALKVLHAERATDARARKRFQLEVEALARLPWSPSSNRAGEARDRVRRIAGVEWADLAHAGSGAVHRAA